MLSDKTGGVPDEPTGSADGGGADHADGEAWHRHRRVHTRPHKQHLPAQLRDRRLRSAPCPHHTRHRARSRVPKGNNTFNMYHSLSFMERMLFVK